MLFDNYFLRSIDLIRFFKQDFTLIFVTCVIIALILTRLLTTFEFFAMYITRKN